MYYNPCSCPSTCSDCSFQSSTRLSRLNDKLDIVNSKIQQEKNNKNLFIQSKIDTAYQQLNDSVQYNSNKFSEIKESILNLYSLLDQIKKNENKRLNDRTILLSNLEKKFDLRYEQEQDHRKIIEDKMSKIIDSKFNDMKLKITEDGKDRFDKIEYLKTLMSRELPKLTNTVKFEKNEREKKDNELKNLINKNSNELQDKINNEIRKREDIDQENLDDVKRSLNNFNKNMRIEKTSREDNENKLLNILELTLEKIDLVNESKSTNDFDC
jgi:hypothetical protein